MHMKLIDVKPYMEQLMRNGFLLSREAATKIKYAAIRKHKHD